MQIVARTLLFALATLTLTASARGIDLFASSLTDSDVNGWNRETNILGSDTCDGCSTCCYRDTPAPSRIQCSADSPTGFVGVYLTADAWSSWSLGNNAITQVSVSFVCAFDDGVSGRMRVRVNGSNVSPDPGVGGNCGWQPELVISAPSGGWTKAAVDALRIGVARDSSTSPAGALYVDAIRLRVTTAPLGACCLGCGSCLANQTSAQCSASGGTWFNGQACTASNCPPCGACCLGCGSCQADRTAAACATSGGVWYSGQACSSTNCVPCTGACCSCCNEIVCSITSRSQCNSQGYSYLGDGTACEPCGTCFAAIRTAGACCAPTGDCSIRYDTACVSPSTYAGDGFCCSPCPLQTGACCRSNVYCSVLAGSRCSQLAPYGYVYLGDNTTCQPCPPRGTCCVPDGNCVVVTAGECTAARGFAGFAGSTCTPEACISVVVVCRSFGCGAARLFAGDHCYFTLSGQVEPCEFGFVVPTSLLGCEACPDDLLMPISAFGSGGTDIRWDNQTWQFAGNGYGQVWATTRVVANTSTSGGLGPPEDHLASSASLEFQPDRMLYSAIARVPSRSTADPQGLTTNYSTGCTSGMSMQLVVDCRMAATTPIDETLSIGSVFGSPPSIRIGYRLWAGDHTFSVGIREAGAELPLAPVDRNISNMVVFVPSACKPDVDINPGVTVNDLFVFLEYFFAHSADFNQSGETTVEDIFAYLSEFFAGCN